MIELTPFIQAALGVLISALVVLAVTEIVPRVQKLWQPFKNQYPIEADFLERQASLAVTAAEKFIDGPGEAKLIYALDFVEKQANQYGFSFDEDTVRTFIEAKVKELEVQVAASIGQTSS